MKYFLTLGVLLASVAILPAQAMTPAGMTSSGASQASQNGLSAAITQVRMDGDDRMHGRRHMHRRHMHRDHGMHRGRMHRHHGDMGMHHGDRDMHHGDQH